MSITAEEWDYWESTHIELPKDSDGEPIHVGDVMDFSKNVRGLTVLGIGIADANESSYGVFVREGNEYVWYNAKFLHHHVPTVEDVLREFAYGLGVPVADSYVAATAAKLRLAGDAE